MTINFQKVKKKDKLTNTSPEDLVKVSSCPAFITKLPIKNNNNNNNTAKTNNDDKNKININDDNSNLDNSDVEKEQNTDKMASIYSNKNHFDDNGKYDDFDVDKNATYDLNISKEPPKMNDNITTNLIAELKKEVASLRYIVLKLNSQLAHYQSKYSLNNLNEEDEMFTSEDVVPAWLVSYKQLVPLLTEYDNKMKKSHQLLLIYKEELNLLKQKLKEVLKENSRLHTHFEQSDLPQNHSSCPSFSMTHLKHLKKQCFLVLEENQLLITQMCLQKEKMQYFATERDNKAIEFFKAEEALKKEKDQLRSEKEVLENEIRQLKREKEEQIENLVKQRTCRELTDLREKIMKFEILLEETSFVKKKIEAENVGLAEAVDDFMRDKDEAVITKKNTKSLIKLLKGSNAKILKINEKQRQLLNLILNKAGFNT